jgi:IS30 family transposase
MDIIIENKHKGALLSLVERKSKFTLIRKPPTRRPDLVAEAATDLLNPYKEKVRTITADNGQGLAHHK